MARRDRLIYTPARKLRWAIIAGGLFAAVGGPSARALDDPPAPFDFPRRMD